MLEYSGQPDDFVALLLAFPEPIETLRGYVLGGFGIFVPTDDPYAQHYPHIHLWNTLADAKGNDRAADIVAELVVSKGGTQVVELVQALAADREVHIRADDTELVHVLFQDPNTERDLGHFVAEYWERSRGPMSGPGMQPPEPPRDSPSPDLTDPDVFVDSEGLHRPRFEEDLRFGDGAGRRPAPAHL